MSHADGITEFCSRVTAVTILVSSLAAAGVAACVVAAQTIAPSSRAERTNFEETSRYGDVTGFLDALAAQTDRLRVEWYLRGGPDVAARHRRRPARRIA